MVCGALACALVAMVARICQAAALVSQADALRERMGTLRQQDERAYEAVVAAKGDREAMQRALLGAAQAPLTGAQACVEALRLAQHALELDNPHLMSDVGCAAEFAYSAYMACIYNVRINHKYLKDEDAIALHRARIDDLQREADALHLQITRSSARQF